MKKLKDAALIVLVCVLVGVAVFDPLIDNQPQPTFTDQVQESIKGVVHLQAPSWQASGFVVGPRLIVTARHCVEGVEDFLITTSDDHQVRAIRAISDKEHDVAFVFVDDLTCTAEERGTSAHEVVLQPLQLGSIKDCVLGQSVYSIGSTFGKAHFNAVATGIIQTLDLDLENFGLMSNRGWATLFSNTVEGGGGNSGCPLFTMNGKVIGVWVGSIQPNVHYCIPVDLFLNDLDDIRLMFTMDHYQREVEPESEFYYAP